MSLFIPFQFFHLMNFNQEIEHTVRFEKNTRYYVIRLEKDLLDYWVVTLINGRIGSKIGQKRNYAFETFQEAFDFFCEVVMIRNYRDYRLVHYQNDNLCALYLMGLLAQTSYFNKMIKQQQMPGFKRISKPSLTIRQTKIAPQLTDIEQLEFCF